MTDDTSPRVDTEKITDRGRRSPMQTAIKKREIDLDSGAYVANTRYVLNEFAAFCELRQDVRRPSEVDAEVCREYARYLRELTEHDDVQMEGSTANTYYDYVRGFLTWVMREGDLDTNPAMTNKAEGPLPRDTGSEEQQFWRPRTRKAFLSYMDKQADETLDATDPGDNERLTIMRDRAIVYLVALSAARGAELFATSKDDRRNGLDWSDVDLEAGLCEVLGKTGEYQDVRLLEPTPSRLERYKQVLDPPSEDWPVFPTRHYPSVYGQLRETFDDRGWSDDRIERVCDEWDGFEAARKFDVPLPSISVATARRIVEEHSKAADEALDSDLTGSDGDPLKLHGARRGLGSELYAADSELSQKVLRHQSIETTRKAYSEQRAKKEKAEAEDVLYGGDSDE